MSQAASAVSQVYSPTFGAGSPVPTPPANTAAALGSLNLQTVAIVAGAIVAGVFIFKRLRK